MASLFTPDQVSLAMIVLQGISAVIMAAVSAAQLFHAARVLPPRRRRRRHRRGPYAGNGQ